MSTYDHHADAVRQADLAGEALAAAVRHAVAAKVGNGSGGDDHTKSLSEAHAKADEAHAHAGEAREGFEAYKKKLAAAERTARDALGIARHADQSALKYCTAHEDLLRDLERERRKRKDLEIQQLQNPGGMHNVTNEIEQRLKQAVEFAIGPWAKSRTYALEYLSGQVRPRGEGQDSHISSLLPAFMRKTPNTDLQQVWDQLAEKDKWFQDQGRQLAREDDLYQELCEKERELIWHAGLNEAAYGSGKLRIVLAGSALREHQLHLLTLEQEIQKVLTDVALQGGTGNRGLLYSVEPQLDLPMPAPIERDFDSPRHSELPERANTAQSETASTQAVPEHILEALRRAEAKAEAASVRAENAARDAQAAASGAQGSHQSATQASRASEDAARKIADEAARAPQKPMRPSMVVRRDEAKTSEGLLGPLDVLRDHLKEHPDDEASKEAVVILLCMKDTRAIRERGGGPAEIFEGGFKKLIEKEGFGDMGKRAVDEIEGKVKKELESAMKGGSDMMVGLRAVMNEGIRKACLCSCVMVAFMCTGAFVLMVFNDDIQAIIAVDGTSTGPAV